MPASAKPSELTALERVDLLEKLQRQEGERRRKTTFAAWGSVGIATFVLIVLIFGAWWYLQDAQSQLRDVKKERAAVTAEIERLELSKKQLAAEVAKLHAELTESKAQQALLTQTLGYIPQAQRQEALEYQFRADPKGAEVLPRAYLQIVDAKDREWAKEMSQRLEKAGIVVAGIEYVPKAAGLKDTDVRYYKKSELEGAEKIVKVLESAGAKATTKYLKEENNTKVRPNHYEVWFAPGSRNIPLR